MSQKITREDVARQGSGKRNSKWRLFGGVFTRSYKSGHGDYQMAIIEGDNDKWPYIVRFEKDKITSGEAEDMGKAVQAQYDAIVEHHNIMSEDDEPSLLEQLDALFSGTHER